MKQEAPEGNQASGGPSSAAGPSAGAPSSAPASTAPPKKLSWKARPPKSGSNAAAAGAAPTAALGVPPAAAPHVLLPTKSQDSHTGSKGTAGVTDVNQATSGTGVQQRVPTSTPAQAAGGSVPGQFYQQQPYTNAGLQAPPSYGQPYQQGLYPPYANMTQQVASGIGSAQPMYAGNAVPPGYGAISHPQQQQQQRILLDGKTVSMVRAWAASGQPLPEVVAQTVAAVFGITLQEAQQRCMQNRLWDGCTFDRFGALIAVGMQQQVPGHVAGVPTGSTLQAAGGSVGAVPHGSGAPSVSANAEQLPSLGSAGGSQGLPSAGGSYSGMVSGIPPMYNGQQMAHPVYPQQYAVHPQTGVVPMMPPGMQAAWLQQQQAGLMGQGLYGTHQPGMVSTQAQMHPGYMQHPQQPMPGQDSMQQGVGPSMHSVKHPLQRTITDVPADQRDLPARAVTSLQFVPGQLCALQQDEMRVCGMTVHPCLKDWAEACQAKWKQTVQARSAEEREEIYDEFEKQVNMNKLYEARATELCGKLRAARKAVAQRLGVKGMDDLPSTWELQGVRAVQDDNKLGRGLVAAQDLDKGYVLGPLGGYILPGGLAAEQSTSLAAHQRSAAGKAGRSFPPLQAGDEPPQDVDWSLDATRYTFHVDLMAEEGGVEQKVTMHVWGLGYGNLGMLINDAITNPHKWARDTSKLPADQAAAAAEYSGKGNNVEIMVVEVRGLPIPLLVTSQPVAAGEPLRLGYGVAYWRAHYEGLTTLRDWFIEEKGAAPPAREKLDSLLPLLTDEVAGGTDVQPAAAVQPGGVGVLPAAGVQPGGVGVLPAAGVQPGGAGEQASASSASLPAVQSSIKQEVQPTVQPTVPPSVLPTVQPTAPPSVLPAVLPTLEAVQTGAPEEESVEDVIARRRARYAELRNRGQDQQQLPGVGSPQGGSTSVPQAGALAVSANLQGRQEPSAIAGLTNGPPTGFPAGGTTAAGMEQAVPSLQPTTMQAEGASAAGVALQQTAAQAEQLQATQTAAAPRITADPKRAAARKAILESSAALIDNTLLHIPDPTRGSAARLQGSSTGMQGSPAGLQGSPAGLQGSAAEPDMIAQRRARFQSMQQERMAQMQTETASGSTLPSVASPAAAVVGGAGGVAGAGAGAGARVVAGGLGGTVPTIPSTAIPNGKAVHVTAPQPDATAGAQKRGREEVAGQPAGDGANHKRGKEAAAGATAGHTMQPPSGASGAVIGNAMQPPPGVTPHMGSVLSSIQPPADLASQAVAAYEACMRDKSGDGNKPYLLKSLNDGSWQQKMQQPPWYAEQLKQIQELNQAITWRAQ